MISKRNISGVQYSLRAEIKQMFDDYIYEDMRDKVWGLSFSSQPVQQLKKSGLIPLKKIIAELPKKPRKKRVLIIKLRDLVQTENGWVPA